MEGRDKTSKIENTPENHEVALNNRERLNMSGVKEVVSFDDTQIQLETSLGSCLVKGEDLNIQQLNLENGKLIVDGKVNTIDYNAKGTKSKNLINRIFK